MIGGEVVLVLLVLIVLIICMMFMVLGVLEGGLFDCGLSGVEDWNKKRDNNLYFYCNFINKFFFYLLWICKIFLR